MRASQDEQKETNVEKPKGPGDCEACAKVMRHVVKYRDGTDCAFHPGVEQVVRAAVDAVIVGLRARATREEVTADRWLAVDVATSSCHRLAANVLREECDRLEKGV